MGSSPRVWGTLPRGVAFPYDRGLIPTGVGNTPAGNRDYSPRWAHPHGCGEHHWTQGTRPGRQGSSPRVWGTLLAGDRNLHTRGLIPTGVGNTRLHNRPAHRMAAHPHGCGEHRNRNFTLRPRCGSSPRVWGTPRCLHLRSDYPGAHPHGCGEHRAGSVHVVSFWGSSPRVWGTQTSPRLRQRLSGLIPTGVGNTRRIATGWLTDGAHPHGCGEHSQSDPSCLVCVGSSPRVWGTRLTGLNHPRGLRLIPTGVGNTAAYFLVAWVG